MIVDNGLTTKRWTKSLRKLCVLCDSAVKENEKHGKPQRRRGRRVYAENFKSRSPLEIHLPAWRVRSHNQANVQSELFTHRPRRIVTRVIDVRGRKRADVQCYWPRD